ncbi:hypothetical protein [Streptomyces sp. NPDC001640]
MSGVIVDVQPKQAAAFAARIRRDALNVRVIADEIREWIAS